MSSSVNTFVSVNKKILLSGVLLFILAFSSFSSANAERFTVTTNKHIYGSDEKIVVVGFVPENATSGYAVLIQVLDPAGKLCAKQNILPSEGNSFLSRPLNFNSCKLEGEYTLTAYYADLVANSTFTVSGNQTDSADRLELRMIKNIVINSQERINTKLKDIIAANYTISMETAETYRKAISEVSITLQAVELGDTAEAKAHQISAIRYFRIVLDTLNKITEAGESASSNRAASDDSGKNNDDIERLREYLNRLQVFYERLVELAEINGIEEDQEFVSVRQLLNATADYLSQGDTENATKNMAEIDSKLEAVRLDLFEKVEQERINSVLEDEEEKDSSDDDKESTKERRELEYVAGKLERKAFSLLEDIDNQTQAAEDARILIRESLLLIANSTAQLEQEDYSSARQSLVDARDLLDEAKELIRNDDSENDEDESKDNEGSGDKDNRDEDEENSGSGKDDDDDDEKNSNSGRDNEDK